MNDTLQSLLDRITAGTHVEADLTTLRRALLVSGQGNVVQIGKYNIYIDRSDDLQIGNHTYSGSRLEILLCAIRKEQERIAADEQARALQSYFGGLHRYCTEFPYLTLHDIRPPRRLDEVYVPLRTRPRKAERQNGRLTEQDRTKEIVVARDLTISEALTRNERPHLLVLGEPGAGKSTLLRQLAERAWSEPQIIGLKRSHLPLLLSLRNLARAEGSPEQRLRFVLGETLACEDPPYGFLRAWPAQCDAPWLLLLDGLDEVPSEGRVAFLGWLQGFLNSFETEKRIVLTTRPTGYEEGDLRSLEEHLERYELLAFNPEQVQAFAEKWFDERSLHFLGELERVHGGALSGTPLLLTVAANVYSREGHLPERRSKLYAQFVDLWLQEIIENKGLINELGRDVCDLARPALERLAQAMTKESQRIDEAYLMAVAASYLGETLDLHTDRAKVQGKRLILELGKRSAILTRRGGNYDWIHPTFREYLAAAAIVHECETDISDDWERVISYWQEEDRRQVALFALDILSDMGQDVTSLVRRIWESGGERGLYFAGAALAEPVQVSECIANDIIDSLLRDAIQMKGLSGSYSIPLTILGELRVWSRAAEGCLGLAQDPQIDLDVRINGVEALGRLGCADKLLALARDEKTVIWVRRSAVEALDRLRQAEYLLMLAWDTRSYGGISVCAVKALGRLEKVHDLLALGQASRIDSLVRERAAEELERIGCTQEAAAILLGIARAAQMDARAGQSAAAALGRLGRIDDLLALAKDVQVDERVRWAVAEALVELGRVEELLAIAQDGQLDEQVRWSAAMNLPELISSDEMDMDELAPILAQQADGVYSAKAPILMALAQSQEMDSSMRLLTAETLAKMGWIDDLLTLAKDVRSEEQMRIAAAEKLGKLGHRDKAASILLSLAEDRQIDGQARVAATEALGSFDVGKHLPELDKLASQDTEKDVRRAARWAAEAIRERRAVQDTSAVHAAMREKSETDETGDGQI